MVGINGHKTNIGSLEQGYNWLAEATFPSACSRLLVISTPTCHTVDPGSIPGQRYQRLCAFSFVDFQEPPLRLLPDDMCMSLALLSLGEHMDKEDVASTEDVEEGWYPHVQHRATIKFAT
jgi:hypothetical protein